MNTQARTPSFFAKYGVWLTALFVMASLAVTSLFNLGFGTLSFDSDDTMRWVQIQDVLSGQSWFDLHQYRLGPEGGTLMHWSRIPDLPILVLYKFLDVFLPQPVAAALVISVYPPVLAGLCVWAFSIGARNLQTLYTPGQKILTFVMVLSAVYLFHHFRFQGGAMDHHNVQILCLAFGVTGLIDPAYRARSFVMAGVMTGLSVSIGMEVYLFIAVFCGFVAVLWAIKGEAVKRAAMAFGLALALTVGVIFFGTIAPSNYSQVWCDAFSLITLVAGLAGGAGLSLLAWRGSDKSLNVRFLGLVALGVICLAIFLILAPHCLSNPLSDLPLDVKTYWLDKIGEAVPLIGGRKDWVADLPYLMGPPSVALGLCLWNLLRGGERFTNGLFATLLLVSIGMTFYQVRFFTFGQMFTILPFGVWIAQIYRTGKAKSEGSVGYLLALIIAAPLSYAAISHFLGSEENTEAKVAAPTDVTCYGNEKAFTYYQNVPPARVMANTNAAPKFLLYTQHSVLTGNYHRNLTGITAGIDIMLADAASAHAILNDNAVTYIHFCPEDVSTVEFAKARPEGLTAQLIEGVVPSYLERVQAPDDNSTAVIYRVKPSVP